MRRIKSATLLTVLLLTSGKASPQEISESLHQADGWTVVETRASGLSILEKDIQGLPVNAVMVRQRVEINPEILFKVVEDVSNYGQFLHSVKGLECRILEKDETKLVAYQVIKIPVISDRVYAFTLFRPAPGQSRIDWYLLPQEEIKQYEIEESDGVYMELGVGSWSLDKNLDGSYDLSYRLVMHPGGWIPDSVSDRFNRVSIAGIFEDILRETIQRQQRGNG